MGNICFQESAVTAFTTDTEEQRQKLEADGNGEEDDSNVIYGPVNDIDIPDIGIGEWCYQTMSQQPPDFVFMIEASNGREITVHETLKKIIGLVMSLKRLGIKKHDRVCVLGDNTIEVNVIALATFFIGAVLNPIDPTMKTYELQHVLKIVKPNIIMCDIGIFQLVQEAVKNVGLNTPMYAIGAKETDNVNRLETLLIDAPIDDFAPEPCIDIHKEPLLLMCSSGTTGLPKAVELPVYSGLYQACCVRTIVTGVILHASYFYWITGVLCLLIGTVFGRQRILLKSTQVVDYLKAVHRYKVNATVFSPSLIKSFLDHPKFSEYDVSSLNLVISGGSPLMNSTIEKFKKQMPNSIIMQGYGATEIGGIVLASGGPGVDPLSLGEVLPNIKIKIVDLNTLHSMGPEEEGELWAQTPTLMNKYYGNEEATREAITKQGWYRTGDICKYNSKGVFYLTGRIKEMMKVDNHQMVHVVSGTQFWGVLLDVVEAIHTGRILSLEQHFAPKLRVEGAMALIGGPPDCYGFETWLIAPAEIEEVILKVPGVIDAIVVGINIDENSLPLALVVKDNSGITADDIFRAVGEKLSEFKQLRAGVYFVDSIPRTGTGKPKRIVAQKIGEELYNGTHKL